MGIFRSEKFVHKKIRIPRESAAEILNELGNLEDCLEFIDMNKEDLEAKKNFGSMIKRCDEMEKKITSVEGICEQYNLQIFKYDCYNEFQTDIHKDEESCSRLVFGNYFDNIESQIIEDEKRLIELIESYTQIDETLQNLYQRKEVLTKTFQLLASSKNNIQIDSRLKIAPEGVLINNMDANIMNPKFDIEVGIQSGLDFLAGVIKAEDEMRMKRMVFRISKGRALTHFWDMEPRIKSGTKKETNIPVSKIFAIFFQGGEENVLKMKVLKICDIFNASRYTVPSANEIGEVLQNIYYDINDKMAFLKEAENSIMNFLTLKYGVKENQNSELLSLDTNNIYLYEEKPKYPMYKLFFKKEKLIYSNLNKCILRDSLIDGEVWIPVNKYEKVLFALKNVFKENETRMTATLFDAAYIDDELKPPTFIPTNDFLWAFQEIVDTYGIPRYEEINPAYFNIVTFPFLFGVMFGDIGHGFLLLLLGLYLCLCNDKIKIDKKNILRNLLKGRYIILMMGFFAFYCGWLYNDFFSIPLEVFSSCYKNDEEKGKAFKDSGCVYPFGLDHKWYSSPSELTFFNSLKMKISVILGVIHMLFGVFLNGLNALYFGDNLVFFWGFIPQFIFMSILFGYMDLMIYVKWATDWEVKGKGNAPNLINQMMNIFLKIGSVQDKPLWDQKYNGKYVQEWVQLTILILALILIPMMLFVIPIAKYKKIKNHNYEQNENNEDSLLHEVNSKLHVQTHSSHSFSEIFIHQVIETIEFVLGAVSNTASYLRLWALSLAHGQLSKVFFEKSIGQGIAQDNVIIGTAILFFGFVVFASVTFFVLMCMDLMECFLHTLRLHW